MVPDAKTNGRVPTPISTTESPVSSEAVPEMVIVPMKIEPYAAPPSITVMTLEQAVSALQVAKGKRISTMIEKVILDLSKLQKFEGKAEVIDRLRTELESHFSRELAGNALEGGTKAIMSRMECHALRLLRNMELIIEEVPAPFSETPAG